MFNFIFDGKIGEILAPIKSSTQQLYLAIQHHRSEEVIYALIFAKQFLSVSHRFATLLLLEALILDEILMEDMARFTLPVATTISLL